MAEQPLTRAPRKPKAVTKAASDRPAPACAPAADTAPPVKRKRVLDDLTAEEDFINTDDDVRVALGGMIDGR